MSEVLKMLSAKAGDAADQAAELQEAIPDHEVGNAVRVGAGDNLAVIVTHSKTGRRTLIARHHIRDIIESSERTRFEGRCAIRNQDAEMTSFLPILESFEDVCAALGWAPGVRTELGQ